MVDLKQGMIWMTKIKNSAALKEVKNRSNMKADPARYQKGNLPTSSSRIKSDPARYSKKSNIRRKRTASDALDELQVTSKFNDKNNIADQKWVLPTSEIDEDHVKIETIDKNQPYDYTIILPDHYKPRYEVLCSMIVDACEYRGSEGWGLEECHYLLVYQSPSIDLVTMREEKALKLTPLVNFKRSNSQIV